MDTLITKCKSAKKTLVVAGCVPQGSRDLKELEGIGVIGVQQIDRVVEVVEETLKGHEVRLLSRKTLPSLDLRKVRKKKFIEILPINVGCLGACTCCKTNHARGHLGSYIVENLVERVKVVISEGVKEIWLSSEDTGAYGTPAARMKKVPSTVVKNRSRELTSVFESFNPYKGMKGQLEKFWITEIATDGIHLVGHRKGYVQVLVIAPESMLGTSTDVKITSVGRWSVFGEVLDFPEPPPPSTNPTAQTTLTAQATSTNPTAQATSTNPTAQATLTALATSINNSCHNCMCSGETEPCNIVLQSSHNCCQNICDNEVSPPDNTTDKVVKTGALRSKMLVSSFSSQIRRRFQSDKKNNEHDSQSVDKQERNCISRLATFDWILLAGMFSSCVVIVVLLVLSYS